MYFPVGWPTVLRSYSGDRPIKLLSHCGKNYIFEVREKSISVWQSRLNLLAARYVRSEKCIAKHGPTLTAALKPDGSVLVIATAKGQLLFLRVRFEAFSPDKQTQYSTREHGVLLHYGSESSTEGRAFETAALSFLTETAVSGGVTDVVAVCGQLMVATSYGALHRLGWDGHLDNSLTISLSEIPFSSEQLPETKGAPLGGTDLHVQQLCYSPELHSLALVLSDGRGAFVSSRSSRLEPQGVAGVWMTGLTDATCTAINVRFKLIAFGKRDGSVEVYSLDETSGVWSVSHTLKFSRSQFPGSGIALGPVESVQWSHGDSTVIAVAWTSGGLSLWTVFGFLLLCSLGDQPGTPSPLNPHCTNIQSMCWSPDSYHLWMLPKTEAREITSGEQLTNQNAIEIPGQVIILAFMKNSIIDNPISINHEHLFLLGPDRLYVNQCRRTTPTSATPPSSVSSPQWKVVLYPPSYTILNWPIRYAAVSEGAVNLAVAGRAGFALYSGVRRKWKLFGNEVQEQSLVCRGGLAWYHDVVVFPCRVQGHSDELRFYSLHSNLDNSQLLKSLRLTSPVVRLNLHGNHLFLASRDSHVIILALGSRVVPNQGLVLSVEKLHEVSVKSLPTPWSSCLVSITPSSIRTEPSQTTPLTHPLFGSVLLNVSGKVMMIQLEDREQESNHQDEKRICFSAPVCLAGCVEALWTPPITDPAQNHHLLESLWLACGASGIKVWLPLYPRDEGHPTFLSKRIMLTLPIAVYPQVVLFSDAIMFGLSHETAFTDSAHSLKHPFSFATIERTTHVFLHHILRQLLRRNLGGHALQIARSSAHLPYFRHVLELMLHEILEEEAPRSRSMPVPDALLPGVVEFIKQFPEFLETVGHCARKTEIALWQYLFAAVGNPRALFELSLTNGSLTTAATYLIIIQNLEPPAVSRQLATKLLDASLDTGQWELCKDLVRFLKTIGPGDGLDSPLLSTTPRKTPTPTQGGFPSLTSEGEATPTSAGPDLDRSAMSVTRDHLISGSGPGQVSLSGEFRDSLTGKVIRRPQFVMEVDSKEDYFIELILCRHARKLLTSRALRDLGRFNARLDFSLASWLAKERLRAARVDDFVATLTELHEEFQWPFPPFNDAHTFSPASTIRGQSATPSSSAPDTPTRSHDLTLVETPGEPSNESSSSQLRRANRPPDLDLTPAITVAILRSKSQRGSPTGSKAEFDPARSSTPSKRSGSIVSEKISLVMKPNLSSAELNTADVSSLGDILEESDWELNSVVAMAANDSTRPPLKASSQSEKEIRYFAEMMLGSQCCEWGVVLGVLLLDSAVITRALQAMTDSDPTTIARTLQGYQEMCNWADNECPGYAEFLVSVSDQFEQLSVKAQELHPLTPVVSQQTTPLNSLHEASPLVENSLNQTEVSGQLNTSNGSNCVIS